MYVESPLDGVGMEAQLGNTSFALTPRDTMRNRDVGIWRDPARAGRAGVHRCSPNMPSGHSSLQNTCQSCQRINLILSPVTNLNSFWRVLFITSLIWAWCRWQCLFDRIYRRHRWRKFHLMWRVKLGENESEAGLCSCVHPLIWQQKDRVGIFLVCCGTGIFDGNLHSYEYCRVCLT